VFPVLDLAGQLTAIQGRVIASAEYGPKVLTRGDLSAGVFQTSQDALAGSFVVIVEAPIDALSLAAAGMQAVALCGTTLPSWLPPALAFRRIALAFDADSAGDAATAKTASELRAFGCDVERWRPSVKDWNEVLLTHGADTLEPVMDFSSRRQSQKPWAGARNRPQIGRPKRFSRCARCWKFITGSSDPGEVAQVLLAR